MYLCKKKYTSNIIALTINIEKLIKGNIVGCERLGNGVIVLPEYNFFLGADCNDVRQILAIIFPFFGKYAFQKSKKRLKKQNKIKSFYIFLQEIK